jgi:hypothetical protein
LLRHSQWGDVTADLQGYDVAEAGVAVVLRQAMSWYAFWASKPGSAGD